MSKDIYTDSTETTEVTDSAENKTADAEGEVQYEDIDGLLVLATENVDHPVVFPLSVCQMYVAIQSLLYKAGQDCMKEYSDAKLLRSKDRKESLNRLLHSIDRAMDILRADNIPGGVFVYHPKREDEDSFRLSFTQAAVVVARLGINPEEHTSIMDEALDVIYGPDWEPKFDPDPEASERKTRPAGSHPFSAMEIKKLLDKTIIGQDEAKETLAAALFEQALNDRYNVVHKNDRGFMPLKRKNILLYGPSGTGKTALIQKVSEILDKPVVIFDASRLTPAGYEGSSSSEILQALLARAGGDAERASHGIVYLDECDKCFLGASGDRSLGRFKGSVAYELLRMLDGCEVDMGKGIILNTAHVQFILGGAFPYLDDIVRARTRGVEDTVSPAIGFCVEQKPTVPVRVAEDGSLPDATIEDLKIYGLPAELLGRISVICRLKKLTKEELVRILADSDQSPLKQYRQKLSMVNVSLEMSKEAMETVAELAMGYKLGARGLEHYLRKALNPVMFTIGNNRKRIKLELKPECFTLGAAPVVLPVTRKQQGRKV